MSVEGSDETEAICDAIVAELAAAQEEAPNYFDPIRFTARKPKDPLQELEAELTGIHVLLVPYAESEEKIGRPQFIELHTVSIWVVRKLDATWTRERMSGVVKTIKTRLRGRKMAGFTYSNCETATKFDLQRLHKGQFMGILRASYAAIK